MEALMKYISRTSRCASLFRANRLAQAGLDGCQYTYILHICHSPGLSQEQLADHIFINKSNVTRQLAILEQNGFVTRTACETDRRVMLVWPTDKAREVYPTVCQVLDEWNQYLMEDFSPEEQAELCRMMEIVLRRAETKMRQLSDSSRKNGGGNR